MRPPKSMFPRILVLLAPLLLLPLLCSSAKTKAPSALTHARVVSLGLVQGTVIVREPGSPKWKRATLDMSLEEGMAIATARDSLAEVQFESGSTLRIGELSRVDFTQLALAARGGRINRMNIEFGLVTANVLPGRHDQYILSGAGATLAPRGKSEFRVDATRSVLRVEVFQGRIEATDSMQTAKLEKNHVLTYDDGSRALFQVSNPIHADSWDTWVRNRDEQAALAEYRENAAMNAVLNDWSHVVPPPGLLAGGIVDDGF